jgi:hypothetical protein
MNTRTYNVIVNICLAVVIGTAFLFNAAGPWYWLVGGIGVLAGIIAAITYFYDRWSSEGSTSKESSLIDKLQGPEKVETNIPPDIENNTQSLGGVWPMTNPTLPVHTTTGIVPGLIFLAYNTRFPKPVHLQMTEVWDRMLYGHVGSPIPAPDVLRENLLQEIEKVVIPESTAKVELVVTKEDDERKVLFVVYASCPSRFRVPKERGTSFKMYPSSVIDATASPIS